MLAGVPPAELLLLLKQHERVAASQRVTTTIRRGQLDVYRLRARGRRSERAVLKGQLAEAVAVLQTTGAQFRLWQSERLVALAAMDGMNEQRVKMEAIVEHEKKERLAAERELQVLAERSRGEAQRARQEGASKANAAWEQALGLQAGSRNFTLVQYQQMEAHLVETLARAAVDHSAITRLRLELEEVKDGAHELAEQCALTIELADQAKLQQARADDALVASAKATESAAASAATTMVATQAAARAIAGSAAASWRLVVSLHDVNEDQANATVEAAVVLATEAAKAAAESAAKAMAVAALARVVARPLTKVACNTKAEAKATAVEDAGLVAAGGAATTGAAAGGLKGVSPAGAALHFPASSKSYRYIDLNPFHFGSPYAAQNPPQTEAAVQVRAHVKQEVAAEAQRHARMRGRRGKLHLWQAWAYWLVYISPRPIPWKHLGVEYFS